MSEIPQFDDTVLEVLMDPVMTDYAKFAEMEEDAVFEHAVALAQEQGVNVGEPEFDDIYRTVRDARQDSMRWSYYLAFVSLATLKVLLESGDFELRVDIGSPDEMGDGLARSLSKASMALLSAFLHVVSGPDDFWVDNTGFASAEKESRSVSFEFQQIGVTRGDA